MCFTLTLWNEPTIDRLNSDQTPSILLVCTSPTTHCSAEWVDRPVARVGVLDADVAQQFVGVNGLGFIP